MHQFSFQITMLVHITYWQNPKYDPTIDGSRILKEVHYYISNEKKRNTLFVQHAFKLHWEFLKSKGCQPKQPIVQNDSCFGQFKNARAWYFLGRYHNLIVSAHLPLGYQILWNYFAIGHGKGEVDGACALLKRELRKEQIKPQGVKIQNAKEAVSFLQSEVNKFHVAYSKCSKINE